MNTKTKQQGFTLVELMVALAVSLFLVLGVFQIYIATSDSNRSGHALGRVQENGRFALDYLTRSVRMAGYQGCIDLDTVEVNVIAKDVPEIDVSIVPLRSFTIDDSGNWTPAKLTQDDELNISGTLARDSDVIYIQHASPTGTNVACPGGGASSCDSDNANVHITDNDLGIEKDDLVLVTDCEAADLFRVTNNPNSSGSGNVTLAHANSTNISNRLSKAYQTDAIILKYLAHAYYVKDTGRNNASGDNIFALYRYDREAGAEFEIAEGIEKLRIQYGQRVSGDNLRFVSADDANLDMDEVVAVRISLLAVSNERVRKTDTAVSFNMAGTVVEPSTVSGAAITYQQDRRIRSPFTTTVLLRNLN